MKVEFGDNRFWEAVTESSGREIGCGVGVEISEFRDNRFWEAVEESSGRKIGCEVQSWEL